MKKFFEKWLGIIELRRGLIMAFSRIERLEKATRLGKRSQRYDQIERARRNRYKNWPKRNAAQG